MINPDSEKLFNSYSPASVNDAALVVFRGRTQGGSESSPELCLEVCIEGVEQVGGGGRVSGVFSRDMKTKAQVQAIATQGSLVSYPNNLGATFNEFPSFVRIDSGSSLVATRGQSQPVWEYTDPITGLDTRAGTSGIYARYGRALFTGASLLGAVPWFSHYQIPQPAVGSNGLRFDQFPGAPAAFSGKYIAFKGNFTEGTDGKTGVFYRDIAGAGGAASTAVPYTVGGTAPAVPIAWRGMSMPRNQYVPVGTLFGSTAPPSAAKGQVVFTGLDNEDAPTAGGIYRAKVVLSGLPALTTLVSIGEAVPTVTNPSGNTLNLLGEGLTFDGRYVSFWGAWGTEKRAITLTCPADGNVAVRNACALQSPLKPDLPVDADPNDPNNHTGVTTREVPVHQGILQKDTLTGQLRLVAQTGDTYEDFLFWNFSGNAGQGGQTESEEEEGARWRSAAFVAADGVKVVFKAAEPAADTEPNIFGLYLDMGKGLGSRPLLTSAMFGDVLDPMGVQMPIVALSIERDSFRNGWLAVSASMANAESGWAGIYLSKVL
ncbi:hypothetical protein [Rhodoferax sp.]|uniref:hypothetical protein n=1 Tax=Rhodoferax sp. TaxID=50421 RepID=UPI002612AB6E|nr:hypothetical protein [Rhodoferax sp.]MDD2918800.1 hypothetical protein [Rhodoferax sp.]